MPEQVQQTTRVRRLIDTDITTRRNKTTSIIYYVLNVIEIILALRLVFRLLGANPASPIVNFLYTISAPLVAPFVGIFRQPVTGTSVLEVSTIIAMVIYALLVYLIIKLFRISTRRTVA